MRPSHTGLTDPMAARWQTGAEAGSARETELSILMDLRPTYVRRDLHRKAKWSCALAMAATMACAAAPGLAQGIKAKQVDGRTVYVNAEPQTPTNARRKYVPGTRRLIYWSNTAHRWKPVPAPSPYAWKAAHYAAQEVTNFIAAQPHADKNTKRKAALDPNYRMAARGRAVTSAEIDRMIDTAARRHDVDPNLVKAIIKVESNFNPRAVSRAGAMGLMQLMPQTARELKVKNPFDPEQNVDAGVRHLRGLLDDFGGNVPLSLAAYNAGAGAVTRNGGIPPYAETRNYVRRITGLYGSATGNLMRSTPIRITRDAQGVLTFSNVD